MRCVSRREDDEVRLQVAWGDAGGVGEEVVSAEETGFVGGGGGLRGD